MSPMTTGPMLDVAYLHGFWNGTVFGSVLTLILIGVFFALGGRILIERVWQGHSQFNGDDR